MTSDPSPFHGSPAWRTCVGCRAKALRDDLLRVVAVEDTTTGAEGPRWRLLPDPRRVLPGRGASVHPDPACLDHAERRKAFPRALRVPGPLAVAPLREHVATEQAAGRMTVTPTTEVGRGPR